MIPNNKRSLSQIEKYVKQKMGNDPTGHDWFHADRVRKMALFISREFKDIDLKVVEIASLVHDCIDTKVVDDPELELKNLQKFFKELECSERQIESILFIIQNMSFKGGIKKTKLPIEGKIVQDADRLDALGAIGIARAFAYGGYKNRSIYNPEIKIQAYKTVEEYRNSKSGTINHFYEKLFKLKNLMNTKKAKEIAEKREEFMKEFLDEFYEEWKY